jgi:hypothetical protein
VNGTTITEGGDWICIEPAVPLTEAWRQAHFAAQAVVEVGKLWSVPHADDSHTTMAFDGEQRALTSIADVDGSCLVGALRLADLTLELCTKNDRQRLELHGMTLVEAIGWVSRTGTDMVGAPRQPSVPAPDLPEHALAAGAAFDRSDQDGLHALEILYANAHRLLLGFRQHAPTASPVQCWPHHFDIAVLLTVASDPAGAMTATVGVGLTPPDGLMDQGYLYVSPWLRHPPDQLGPWAELTHGLWIDRGPLKMAVLPLSQLLAQPGQGAAARRFVDEAERACRNAML